jgi:mRNA interferase MazF
MPRRVEPRRGDVLLATLPDPVGRRPVLVVTRSAAIPVRTAVTVAPITRTVRGIRSELPLDQRHGLRTRSVANCDSLQTIPKDALRRRVGTLANDELPALDRALRYALDIRP